MRVGHLERRILMNLYDCEKNGYPPTLANFKYRRISRWWGTPTLGIRNHIFGVNHITSSEKASFSRSLKLLESKGLIETRNHVSDRRYRTHVKLTEKGKDLIAKRGWS